MTDDPLVQQLLDELLDANVTPGRTTAVPESSCRLHARAVAIRTSYGAATRNVFSAPLQAIS
jgi:hypothetical protein